MISLSYLKSKTLYIEDESYTCPAFIAYRTQHELKKQGIDVSQLDLEGAIDIVVARFIDHLHPEEINGGDFYRWELLWLCSPEIVLAIGEVIEGKPVDEDWYFPKAKGVASVFAKSNIHTINLMKEDFSAVTGDQNPLGTMLNSFINGDDGGQAVVKMFKKGTPLKLV